MNRLITIVTIFLLCLTAKAGNDGAWRGYPSYTNVSNVVKAGQRTYVLASGNLYSYDTDADKGHALSNTLTTYTKADVLHDTGISHIAWSDVAQSLVIAYKNGNIDILSKDGTATCVPDFYLKPSSENKTFTGIAINGATAYLFTAKQTLAVNITNASVSNAINVNIAPQAPNVTTPALTPIGPYSGDFYLTKYHNGKLYTINGYVDYGNFIEEKRPANIQCLDLNTGEWSKFDDSFASSLGHIYEDHNDIAIDPRNENHIMVSGKTGVYEFLNGKYVNCWNYTNTGNAIQSYNDKSLNRNIVMTMMYDDDGNLWMINSRSSKPLVLYSNTGEWMSYELDCVPKKSQETDFTSLLRDKKGKMWFVDSHTNSPGIYCYVHDSKKIKKIRNLKTESRFSVKKDIFQHISLDNDGNLLIAMQNDTYLLDHAIVDDIFSYDTDSLPLPVRSINNIINYQNNRRIRVDRAGNIWFATIGNGVFVVDKFYNKLLYHFDKSNSPLPCDDIFDISFDYDHNNVFICTYEGMCSYQTDIISDNEEIADSRVVVTPNPIPQAYKGSITISGLTNYDGCDIVILSPENKVTDKGTISGGKYVWPAVDNNGNRVESGIYKAYYKEKNSDKKLLLTRISVIR